MLTARGIAPATASIKHPLQRWFVQTVAEYLNYQRANWLPALNAIQPIICFAQDTVWDNSPVKIMVWLSIRRILKRLKGVASERDTNNKAGSGTVAT